MLYPKLYEKKQLGIVLAKNSVFFLNVLTKNITHFNELNLTCAQFVKTVTLGHKIYLRLRARTIRDFGLLIQIQWTLTY